MNKRQKQKFNKKEQTYFTTKICIADELKEDSIAHKIKSYFNNDTIQCKMLFKYDKENKKVLVSKKHLIYLLSLCNDVETLRDYDMEIVDKIDIFKFDD